MSFSISSEYYNSPRVNAPVQIIQEEKVDENGTVYIEERIVPGVRQSTDGGNRISSVPYVTGAASDYM